MAIPPAAQREARTRSRSRSQKPSRKKAASAAISSAACFPMAPGVEEAATEKPTVVRKKPRSSGSKPRTDTLRSSVQQAHSAAMSTTKARITGSRFFSGTTAASWVSSAAWNTVRSTSVPTGEAPRPLRPRAAGSVSTGRKRSDTLPTRNRSPFLMGVLPAMGLPPITVPVRLPISVSVQVPSPERWRAAWLRATEGSDTTTSEARERPMTHSQCRSSAFSPPGSCTQPHSSLPVFRSSMDTAQRSVIHSANAARMQPVYC